MIAKSLVLLLVLIILPDVYIWYRYLRKQTKVRQIAWFVPGICFLAATVYFALERDFVPNDMTGLNTYLLLMGLFVAPKVLFSLCSLCGKNGWKASWVLIPLIWIVLLYGSFIGNRQFEVKYVELEFADLPKAFDGYRIVQFSDLHLGSLNRELLEETVDSMNAQEADLLVFTGDIQNKLPDEILPFKDILSKLKAKDGIYSVLGNHDYAEYTELPYEVEFNNCSLTSHYQTEMGWNVLINNGVRLYRDNDSIVVSGMENDGEGRFPQLGKIYYALNGVHQYEFVVMLEHDPSSWRRKILRECHAQLTLSGHTHGAQFELFGWSPLSLVKKECDGLYHVGNRYLYVSKGVGGVVPFRFGAKPEIVVITLRRS